MTNTPELALDLGWCVIRPVPMEQYDRLYRQGGRAGRDRRLRAQIAWHAGIHPLSFKKLTPRQIDEVWFGMGWLLRPHLNPAIGRVVDPEALKELTAPMSPKPSFAKVVRK